MRTCVKKIQTGPSHWSQLWRECKNDNWSLFPCKIWTRQERYSGHGRKKSQKKSKTLYWATDNFKTPMNSWTLTTFLPWKPLLTFPDSFIMTYSIGSSRTIFIIFWGSLESLEQSWGECYMCHQNSTPIDRRWRWRWRARGSCGHLWLLFIEVHNVSVQYITRSVICASSASRVNFAKRPYFARK